MPTYVLTDEEVEKMNVPINGQGGMQTFLRRLRKSLRGNTLSITNHDFDMTCRYLQKMGIDGGWQSRIPEQLKDEALELITRPAVEEYASLTER